MSPYPEEDLNLVQVFLSRARLYKNREALLFKKEGIYKALSWIQWTENVKKTALGLYTLGVRKGTRVAILSENRPEWAFADLGILSLGAITVPLYPTSSCAEILYILENAGIEILFVSILTQCQKIQELASNLKLKRLIAFDAVTDVSEKIMSMGQLFEIGRLQSLNNPSVYDSQVQSVNPEDIATLIYTSGTTGPPKGVMLTHRNFISNSLGSEKHISISADDIALSFLPLSHVFERMAGYYFMIAHGAAIAYAENMQTVPEDLMTVRPTVAAGVPRFYEKVHARIFETLHQKPVFLQKIFHWAMRIGHEVGERKKKQERIPFGLNIQHKLADFLVFHKIREGLGGRIRFFISGGAPLAKELAEFFFDAGILILEGYGLTETSPVIAVNAVDHFKFGTVGQVIPNVEVKIAEDGEILTRGPCVMKGYYQNETATQEALRDGWFHTGDIGLLDDEGFLKITDRKKDIIVNSGGKKIAPQNVENLILGDPLFIQAVVLGDRRNYLVALLVPNLDELKAYANTIGLGQLPLAELVKRPEIYKWAESRLKARTKELAPYEQIKYFALLDHELTQTSGELTPTLKVKRKMVTEKYQAVIEGLYQKGAQKGQEDKG